MADPFTTLVQNLNALGFYDFLLPWLFVFAVIYGLLSRVKLFGDNNNRISALIAFVAAFFAVGYVGVSLAGFFTGMFGGATIILTGILIIVLFLAMAGFKLENLSKAEGKWGKLAVLLIIVIGIVIFMVATGTVVGGVALNQDAMVAILIVIVILLAIWFVTKEEKKSAPTGQPTGQP